VGNSTIDIHVSVTINTNSPSSTLTTGGTIGGGGIHSTSGQIMPHVSSGITPGSTLLTPPGTLADLKKHRSLIRTSSNPMNGSNYTNNHCSSPDSSLVSYPSIRNFSNYNGFSSTPTSQRSLYHNQSQFGNGNYHFHHHQYPASAQLAYASYEHATAVPNWHNGGSLRCSNALNYSQSEFDSSAFTCVGFINSSGNTLCNSNDVSLSPYTSSQDDTMYTMTNTMNNQVYINNLTGGVLNDLPSKFESPPSPTVSLRRYTGDEIVGDYGDGGKKCCTIV
jgi:hypothetical protein